jgi:carbamoyl-phosphate synthase large subunit
VPRFAFEKFAGDPGRLTTQMKSVGEVMAIGRTFQEALQKALRGLEIGACGLDPRGGALSDDQLSYELREPGPERIFFVADALRRGWSIDRVFTSSLPSTRGSSIRSPSSSRSRRSSPPPA